VLRRLVEAFLTAARARQQLCGLVRLQQVALAGRLHRRRGRMIRHHQFGEGGYDDRERASSKCFAKPESMELPKTSSPLQAVSRD
jgi:hypothetical protein